MTTTLTENVFSVCRMDVCSRNLNRTVPVGEDVPQRADVPLCSRTNGWSWPPHPFQLLAWLLYVYFAVTGFGVFVPLLPAHWIPAGYIVSLKPACCDHSVWICSKLQARKVYLGGLPFSEHAHNIHLKKMS